eukprot:Awhi_evm1s8364
MNYLSIHRFNHFIFIHHLSIYLFLFSLVFPPTNLYSCIKLVLHFKESERAGTVKSLGSEGPTCTNFACSLCPKTFKLKSSLQRHQRQEHVTPFYEMPGAQSHRSRGLVVKEKRQFLDMEQKKDKTFKCPDSSCGKSWDRRCDLTKHLKAYHLELSTKPGFNDVEAKMRSITTADVCPETAESIDNEKDTIFGNKKNCVGENGMSTLEKDNLGLELSTGILENETATVAKMPGSASASGYGEYEGKKGKENENEPHTCSSCKKQWPNYGECCSVEKIIVAKESGEKIFECLVCDVRYKRQGDLTKHFRRHHTFFCYEKTCNLSFTSLEKFQDHLASVHPDKKSVDSSPIDLHDDKNGNSRVIGDNNNNFKDSIDNDENNVNGDFDADSVAPDLSTHKRKGARLKYNTNNDDDAGYDDEPPPIIKMKHRKKRGGGSFGVMSVLKDSRFHCTFKGCKKNYGRPSDVLRHAIVAHPGYQGLDPQKKKGFHGHFRCPHESCDKAYTRKSDLTKHLNNIDHSVCKREIEQKRGSLYEPKKRNGLSNNNGNTTRVTSSTGPSFLCPVDGCEKAYYHATSLAILPE